MAKPAQPSWPPLKPKKPVGATGPAVTVDAAGVGAGACGAGVGTGVSSAIRLLFLGVFPSLRIIPNY